MFVIKTRVGPSAIHGTGVFAAEPVAAGETLWRFHPLFDRVIDDDLVGTLPPAALEHLEVYAYRSTDLGGRLVLSGDHAKFLNHDDNPNTEAQRFVSVARRPIEPGDEITCDYGSFCADWAGTESLGLAGGIDGGRLDAELASVPPHENLYTRLQPSSQGVGVFAIRDIPAGTALFLGDEGALVRVPVGQVEQIADPSIRRMYHDFCPVIEDSFIAPTDFNQLTMGWYLNHSDHANVGVTKEMDFIALKAIPSGAELHTDYRTMSEKASVFMNQYWK